MDFDTYGTTCKHPIRRHFCWHARDDTVPSGVILCVACAECGTVLGFRPLEHIKALNVEDGYA